MFRKSLRLRDIERLLRQSRELELSPQVVMRLKWLAFYASHNHNASLTCRHFCIARSTLLKWLSRFDPRDARSLEERSRRPKHMRSPETPEHIVSLIKQYRMRFPTMGKERIAAALLDEHGIQSSPSTVGRVIARHGFFFAMLPSHEEKRMHVSDEAYETEASGDAIRFLQPPLPFSDPLVP